LDFGIGLFPLQGRLSPAVGATLLLVSLIHAWWSVSLAAGAQVPVVADRAFGQRSSHTLVW